MQISADRLRLILFAPLKGGSSDLTSTDLLRRRLSLLPCFALLAVLAPYPFAAAFMVYGFHHQIREAQFFWYKLNRDADRHGNRLTLWQWLLIVLPLAIFFWPKEGTPLHHHYLGFLIIYSLFNGIVHNGLMPQLVLKHELAGQEDLKGLQRWLVQVPALILFVMGVVDAIVKVLWETSALNQVVEGPRMHDQLPVPPRWTVASLGFNGFAHALTWNTTITLKAQADQEKRMDSRGTKGFRLGLTAAFFLYWLYGSIMALFEGPQAFFPVAELFLHISVVHQWSELVFYFSWYKRPKAAILPLHEGSRP